MENRQLGVGSLLFLFPTPLLTPKPFGYKMLPIWLKDFCRVVSTPCASWVGGIFYFKIEKGAYFEGRGECCSLRWSFVVSPGGCCFSSPKHSTPASPVGFLLLEPSSVLQPYYRYLAVVCFFFFFFCKCLSINFLSSPSICLRGVSGFLFLYF